MKEILLRTGKFDISLADAVAESCGVSLSLAKILVQRGVDTKEKAEMFLNAGSKYFHNPFLLKGIKEFTERIKEAKKNNEKVVIYGDYDADGLCASCIMYFSLIKYGVNCVIYIPEREDGYGLKEQSVNIITEKYNPGLIITVDCGISSVNEVRIIKEKGMDIIITDHHEPPEILPDCLIINCKIKEQDYPFDGLCGAGIALKTAYALHGESAYEYLDYATIATIADSMVLTGENRDIVCEGLKILNSGALRPPLKDMFKGLNKQVTSSVLAYSIAPLINSAGRVGDAKIALKLLLSENEEEIKKYLAILNAYNEVRQKECESMYNQAKRMIREQKNYKKAVVLYNKEWAGGFTGIISARLAEEYCRPVILFTETKDGYLKGSARSIEEINLYNAVSGCKDKIVEYGGHSGAAGICIKKEDFEDFVKLFDNYLSENYSLDVFTPKYYADAELCEKVTEEFAKEINKLEPFGVGNRRPVFCLSVSETKADTIKKDSLHIGFNTEVINLLYFNGKSHLSFINNNIRKKIAFDINISNFNGKTYVKGFIKDYCYTYEKDESEKLYAVRKQIRDGESVEGLSVTRDECIKVYRQLQKLGEVLAYDSVKLYMLLGNADAVKLIAITEIFLELGLVCFEEGVFYLDESRKVNLEDSEIYNKYKLIEY